MKHRSDSFTKSSKLEAFRVPNFMAEEARKRALAEDITFSQLMRRALRRELEAAGHQVPDEHQHGSNHQ